MHKYFLIFAIAVSGCTATTENSDGTDSSNTKVPAGKNDPVKSLSVTPPISPVPKQAADSIWNGDYVERNKAGIITKRGYVSGGLASGEWLTFYDDGKPWSKGQYHNGIRTGYGVSWYHDGQMSSEGYYEQGKPVGKWKYWSESDHKVMEKDYGNQ